MPLQARVVARLQEQKAQYPFQPHISPQSGCMPSRGPAELSQGDQRRHQQSLVRLSSCLTGLVCQGLAVVWAWGALRGVASSARLPAGLLPGMVAGAAMM